MFACGSENVILKNKQKEMRVTMSRDLIEMADADDRFLRKIVTGDNTWCFLYAPQTKRQSAEWKSKTSPRNKNFPWTEAVVK